MATSCIPIWATSSGAFPQKGLVAAYEPFRQRNLLRQSVNLADTGAWTRTRLHATEGVTLIAGGGPGGRDAWRIKEDGTAGNTHYIFQSIALSANSTYVLRCFLRTVEVPWLAVYMTDGGSNKTLFVSAVNGSFGTVTGSYFTSYTATPLASGWYELVTTFTTGATPPSTIAFYLSESGSSAVHDGDNDSSLLIAEPQLERVARWNLLNYSEDLTNAAWTTKARVTASAGSFVETAVDGTHVVGQAVTVSAGQNTLQLKIKPLGRTKTQVVLHDGTSNKLNATLDLGAGTTTVGTLVAAGDGYYLLTASVVCAAGSGVVYVYANDDAGNSSYIGDVTKGLYVKEAQLTQGSSPLPYQKTPITTALPSPYVATDALQLIEQSARWKGERRRNLLWKTEEFDDAAWTKSDVAVTPNAVAAPDGTVSADLASPTAGSTNAHLYQTPLGVAPGSYVWSVYIKSASGANIPLRLFSNSSPVSPNPTGAVITVTAAWQRFMLPITVITSGTINVGIGLDSSWAAGEDVHVWGAQLEKAVTPTPYQNPANLFPAQRGSTTAAAGDVNDPAIDSNRWVFDGTNDYVDLLTEDFGGACSLFAGPGEAWTVAVVASAADGLTGTVIGRATEGAESKTFQMFKNIDNKLYLRLRGTGVVSTNTIDTLPHLLVVTWNGTVAKLYVDGTVYDALVGLAAEETNQRIGGANQRHSQSPQRLHPRRLLLEPRPQPIRSRASPPPLPEARTRAA
jgi:hypothetical protein